MLGKEPHTMSDRRSITSALNGAKSRGPITAEGKGRSSRNAQKHGLYSKAIVLRHESAEAFEELHRSYHADFAPTDRFEAVQVDRMAAATWRLRRLNSLADAAIDDAFADLDSDAPARVLADLCEFQSAQSRAYDRAFRNLCLAKEIAQRNIKNPEIEPKISTFRRAACN